MYLVGELIGHLMLSHNSCTLVYVFDSSLVLALLRSTSVANWPYHPA